MRRAATYRGARRRASTFIRLDPIYYRPTTFYNQTSAGTTLDMAKRALGWFKATPQRHAWLKFAILKRVKRA